MNIDLVTKDNRCIMSMNTEALAGAVPITGDIIVTPDNKVFRVVQRTFIGMKLNDERVVDLAAGKRIGLSIQCIIDEVPTDAVRGDNDAIPQ